MQHSFYNPPPDYISFIGYCTLKRRHHPLLFEITERHGKNTYTLIWGLFDNIGIVLYKSISHDGNNLDMLDAVADKADHYLSPEASTEFQYR